MIIYKYILISSFKNNIKVIMNNIIQKHNSEAFKKMHKAGTTCSRRFRLYH